MFKMLLCQCCSPEKTEKAELLHSDIKEHPALPVLLDSRSQAAAKGKAEAMQSGADVMETREAPLSDGPSLLQQEPELSVQPPTVSQDRVKKPDDAQPKSSAEAVPSESAEPEVELQETALEDAQGSAPVANDDDHALPGAERARAPQTGRDSVASKTPEEIADEFSKKAVSGVSCTYFNETTGKRISANYKLSSDLTQFTIEADKRGVFSRFSLTVPVASIQDVDDYDGTSSLVKPKAAATLTNRETEAFLMIFYESQKGDVASICLILSSVESRKRFSIGLKALTSSRQN